MTAGITKKIHDTVFMIGELGYLGVESIKCCLTRPFYFSKLMEQINLLGIGSLSITIVIGLVMGLVMTLQFGFGLAKFGGTLYVPGVVALSLTREMAPIFTSLLVAGRIGSGITAEIGSMNVTQQVDAIRALGTSPIRVLVVPRLLAAMISLPLLTAVSNVLGILGGMVICSVEFHIPPGFYFQRVFSTVKLHDFSSGLLKTVFFATVITLVACYKGFNTTEGTKGVGQSTTWVVVVSSILILISDFFLSKIFLLLLV
ncbi:MAG: ABC transporter permease [Bacteriovoracaceae bacterium]|jgi:phospholipid/cholesterol/gamma-HCH transport system permease protein|nr:ABC transporter permease [Bacteriovoracaceae bacterium]